MKWMANVIGRKGLRNFEISVIKVDNAVGRKTPGMFGANKLLICHSGNPMVPPLHPAVWDKQIVLAEEMADKLNKNG